MLETPSQNEPLTRSRVVLVPCGQDIEQRSTTGTTGAGGTSAGGSTTGGGTSKGGA